MQGWVIFLLVEAIVATLGCLGGLAMAVRVMMDARGGKRWRYMRAGTEHDEEYDPLRPSMKEDQDVDQFHE